MVKPAGQRAHRADFKSYHDSHTFDPAVKIVKLIWGTRLARRNPGLGKEPVPSSPRAGPANESQQPAEFVPGADQFGSASRLS